MPAHGSKRQPETVAESVSSLLLASQYSDLDEFRTSERLELMCLRSRAGAACSGLFSMNTQETHNMDAVCLTRLVAATHKKADTTLRCVCVCHALTRTVQTCVYMHTYVSCMHTNFHVHAQLLKHSCICACAATPDVSTRDMDRTSLAAMRLEEHKVRRHAAFVCVRTNLYVCMLVCVCENLRPTQLNAGRNARERVSAYTHTHTHIHNSFHAYLGCD
jgi:hypothetical protein